MTNSEIIEENNYYPFGLKHKGYIIIKNKMFIMGRFIILILVLFIGCQTNTIYLKSEVKEVRMTPGFKGFGLKKVVCYNYTFNGKTYKQCSKVDHILVDVGDTVKISFDSNKPEKAKVVSVIRNVSKYKDKVVYINPSDLIYSYEHVDRKPLFYMAKSSIENDSLVNQFIKEKLKKVNIKRDERVIIDLTITTDGKAIINNISSNNLNLEILISEIIKKMPKWQPAQKNGKFVKVSFLVVFPYQKSSTSLRSSRLKVSSGLKSRLDEK